MTAAERYRLKLAEAQKLIDQHKDGMPKEVADQVNQFLGEADEIKLQIDLERRVGEGQKFSEDPAEAPKAAHHGWRKAGPDEGNFEIDPKAWHETEVLTPAGMKKLRFHVPLAVQKKEYAPAFEAYMRKGSSRGLSPNDFKTLSEGADSAGGFLVPVDVQTELIRKTATMAIIRGLARIVNTSRDVVSWPKKIYTTDDKYTGPERITWTGEIPSSTSVHLVTDATYGQVDIPINTAMASQPVSNNLIEDSAFDVMSIVNQDLAEAFALGEDDAFINGDGISKPMGILTQVDVAGKGPASVLSGASGAVAADGLIDLWGALPSQYSGPNTRWVMSTATLVDIKQLKDGDNRYLLDAMSTGNLQSPIAQILIDRPILRDEFMPAVAGGAYPIIFGDFGGYIIADRVGFSVMVSRELLMRTNQTLVVGRKRVGGQIAEEYKLKVQKITA
jgi:HK97 family phage major capsid protein